MRIVLLSRYPRVDTPAWKRRLAADLLDHGDDLAVVYTHSRLPDQARRGLREFGTGVGRRYLKARTDRGALDGQDDATPPRTLASWARERGVELSLHDRLGDSDCLRRLRALAPDMMLLVGADIAPAAALEIPRVGTLNGHYGLLPDYRGMNVTEWSIYRDDPVGVSVHLVDTGIDTGAVVAREPISVERGERLDAIRARHQAACARLLADACGEFAAGTAAPVRQRPDEGRQYYRMHPLLRSAVDAKLADGSYRWLGVPREELLAQIRPLSSGSTPPGGGHEGSR